MLSRTKRILLFILIMIMGSVPTLFWIWGIEWTK